MAGSRRYDVQRLHAFSRQPWDLPGTIMHSPVADLLHTSYIPTDAETAQIRGELASHVLEIDNIDEQIRRLSLRRAELCAHVDAHKALISLPRRLPRDIVEELFLACLPGNKNAAIDTTEAPLILGHICSAWRAISLTTPRLWASLHVPFAFVAAEYDRTHVLAEWLGRSGSCPLSLSIVGDRGSRWGEETSHFTPAYVASALGILLQHSPRWKHLQFTRLSPTMLRLLLAQNSPMLQSIEIDDSMQLDPESVLDSEDPLPFKLLQSSSLRGLFLPHLFQKRDSGIWQLPIHWEGITHLVLDSCWRTMKGTLYISFFIAHKILLHCPRLRRLQFTLRDPPETELELSPLPPLPYLEALLVYSGRRANSTTHYANRFWDALPALPQLKKLALDPAGFPADLRLDSILRKMPHLKQLSTASPVRGQVLDFLYLIPSITFIKFHGTALPADWEDLLHLLTPKTGVPDRPCGALEELVLVLSDMISPSCLRNFIEGHIQSQTSFRQLTVDLRRTREATEVREILSKEEIIGFKARGLHIEFVFSSSGGNLAANRRRVNGSTGRTVSNL
ncbi:hypothetical protein C8F01DRAFT_1150705 [Mycena amicta]|nr:hypothetical protein C8F01DRAFT_1150705 [Mycena amicta]